MAKHVSLIENAVLIERNTALIGVHGERMRCVCAGGMAMLSRLLLSAVLS